MQENKEYVVIRNFHMGEIAVSLSAGERLQFDGKAMTRLFNGQRYSVQTFPLLIKGKLVAEDDGKVTFKPANQVTKPKQPTMDVVIDDHTEMVVADIKKPEKIAGRERKSTEELALSKTINNSSIIFDEQRLVGKANIRTAKTQPQTKTIPVRNLQVSDQEDEARVVASIQPAQNALNKALQAEGIGPIARTGTNLVSDTSDGVVIAKVKGYEERKAELAKAALEERRALAEPVIVTEKEQLALQEDIKIALAKRAGKVPPTPKTASKTAPKTASKTSQEIVTATEEEAVEIITTSTGTLRLDSHGFPEGFPRNDHWKKRIDWCKGNRENVDALRIIYAKGTDSFKSQMNTTFVDLNLGPAME